MTSVTARLVAVMIALGAALFLSSCTNPTGSSSDGQTDRQPSDEPVVTGQPAGYNADDVAFATNMI
ncbi:MAG TPA: DUF305 domain-containing protein, partial [Mycobacterium sp.]